MIILYDEKVIALKARKVGGTSFEIALSRYANDTSIITPITLSDEKVRYDLGFRGPQNFRYSSLREAWHFDKRNLIKAIVKKKLPMKYWNHIHAEDACTKLGEHIWNSYTKISIVRNPFDYMVSSYFWGVSEKKRATLSFENYCLRNPGLLLWNEKIYEINGNNVIDFMIRYEHLYDDISALERKIPELKGLAGTFSKLNAKGDIRPKSARTSEMFENAPRSHALISNVCHDAIEKYGFEIP